MFVRRHWAKIEEKLWIDGEELKISCYGGSNESLADAEDEARKKVKLIESKIKGDYSPLENYVVEIREELVEEIDERNIVTRNRYGVLVLNSEDHIFLDLDEPKYGFFDIFKSYSLKMKKEKIRQQAIKVADSQYKDLSFRIYETRRGYRVVAIGKNIAANSELAKSLYKKFNCDPVYSKLCEKQECYRARLTPKPSNMKYKGFRNKYPRTEGEQNAFDEWLEGYKEKSKNYAVCKVIDSIRETRYLDEVITYHDEVCKVESDLPLA